MITGMSKGSPRLVIRLPSADKDALEAMAGRQETTMTEIARPAILAALRKLVASEAAVHDTRQVTTRFKKGK